MHGTTDASSRECVMVTEAAGAHSEVNANSGASSGQAMPMMPTGSFIASTTMWWQEWYGDWAAYIGEVPGENYNCEYGFVMIQGTKLPREVAKILFPGWARMAWRD